MIVFDDRSDSLSLVRLTSTDRLGCNIARCPGGHPFIPSPFVKAKLSACGGYVQIPPDGVTPDHGNDQLSFKIAGVTLDWNKLKERKLEAYAITLKYPRSEDPSPGRILGDMAQFFGWLRRGRKGIRRFMRPGLGHRGCAHGHMLLIKPKHTLSQDQLNSIWSKVLGSSKASVHAEALTRETWLRSVFYLSKDEGLLKPKSQVTTKDSQVATNGPTVPGTTEQDDATGQTKVRVARGTSAIYGHNIRCRRRKLWFAPNESELAGLRHTTKTYRLNLPRPAWEELRSTFFSWIYKTDQARTLQGCFDQATVALIVQTALAYNQTDDLPEVAA